MPQYKIPAVFMRGGTSKALMFHLHDLPHQQHLWPDLFISAIGADDPYGRQLNGMGGGVSSLSKVCVISTSMRPDADVDYRFFQLSPRSRIVDSSASCGNMAAAVGPFAVDEGLVSVKGDRICVRIFNVNTGRIIRSTFSLDEGAAAVNGDLSLPGVSGSGAPINLVFENPGGGATGKLLPTGQPADELQVQDTRFEVSMVDAGNPCVFVRAQDLGLVGCELPDTLSQLSEVLDTLENIRLSASVAMGIAGNINQASAIPGIPKIAIVSWPSDSVTLSAETIGKDDCDLVLRMISVGQPHRAIPVTGALCTAVAGRIEGTLVNQLTKKRSITQSIRIAHPSGVSEVDAEVVEQEDGWHSRSASINRTARRLMDGHVYVSAANPNTGKQ
jgi:2-methylaconitate cis-trans-isomerase PrpF